MFLDNPRDKVYKYLIASLKGPTLLFGNYSAGLVERA